MTFDISQIDKALEKISNESLNNTVESTNDFQQNIEEDERVLAQIEQALGLQFSDEQRDVIFHTGAPLSVISCAGSGKTTVLIGKILFRELRYGIKPSEVLAITFNTKAAKEIEERYIRSKRKLGLPTDSVPTFKTFHALFYMLANRVLGKLKVAKEGGYTFQLLNKIPNSPFYDRKDILSAILDYRSNLINNNLSHDGITLMKLGTPVEVKNKPFDFDTYLEVVATYNKLKKDNNEIDFDDMLVKLYDLTHENRNEQLITLFRQTFKEVYIDEYQDISEIITSIMDELIGDFSKLTIIGDPNQTIYSFRGSKDYFIINFQYRYENAQVLFLGDNYRCPANILNPVIPSILLNPNPLNAPISPYNDGGEIEFYPIQNGYMDLIDDMVSQYHQSLETDESIAILVRLNMQKMLFSDMLAEREIPVDIGNMYYSLRQNKVYKTVIGIIDAIKEERNGLFAQYGRFFLRELNYNVFKYYKDNHSINWYEEVVVQNKYYISESTIGFIQHIKNSNNAKDLILQVWVMVKNYYQDLAKKGYISLDQTLNIFKYLSQIAEGQTFLEFRQTEIRKEMFLQSYVGINGTIKINTLHSVKGLEFDNVYLVGLDGNVFPSETHINYLKQQLEVKDMLGNTQSAKQLLEEYIAEERRLFYVGCTRAKKRLVLSFNYKNPTPFIREMSHPFITEMFEQKD